MHKEMVLDRIPERFCEGPFWGNGKMGAVLYIRKGRLCFSLDHAGLWELRETLPDQPKAGFDQILRHREEYLNGDPRYVEKTNIYDEQICRTRLPALAVELGLPGRVLSFCARTDLERAETALTLELEEGRRITGRIRLDSRVNILFAEWNAPEGCGPEEPEAVGWDLDAPGLRTLKKWGYEPCVRERWENGIAARQRFGGHQTAVLCMAWTRQDGRTLFAAGIDTGRQEQEEELIGRGRALTAAYLARADAYAAAHEKDWADFWSRCDIRVPNERLQEAFWQEMYKLYCSEREDAAPVTLQGIWNRDDTMPAWFGDLHNDMNVQACYWPAFKTGNAGLARPYIEYYTAAMPRFQERARKLFGIQDAVHVPIMMAPDGTGAASEWCYWNTVLGPELFVAVDFTWFYEYTGEKDTLRDKIYPFIEKVFHLYQGIAVEKEDGYLHIPFTMSPEVDRDGRMLMADDATFTLSSLHYLCRKMAGYAALLGKDGSAFEEWGSRLAPVVPDAAGYPLFAGIGVFGSHRHFCQLYPIFPLCEEAHSELADRSLDTAVNQGFLEYAAFSMPYLGIFAARCGRGNMCRTMLELYCMVFRSRNSFTVNGDPYKNGVLRISDTSAGESADSFTLESGLYVPTLLCEMFVHRAGDEIWLMAGLPDEWRACSCRGLAVEGCHRIALEREAYQMRRAVLCAGSEDRFSLRWKEDAVLTRLSRDGQPVPVRDGRRCALSVCAGETWILEFAPVQK